MTVRDFGDLTIYAGAVAGALVAIGAVVRYAVMRPLQQWIREQVGKPLHEVKTELQPDHGRSLHDAINRTETKVDALAARFDQHLTNHPTAGRRLR